MAIAPVLKTGARKGLGVRIPRAPLALNDNNFAKHSRPSDSEGLFVIGRVRKNRFSTPGLLSAARRAHADALCSGASSPSVCADRRFFLTLRRPPRWNGRATLV